ncbi:LPP20 family lipoprotein [uncultured Helicobacter sp.]|uniref:LPP20 family lipoprotein n=1 Tax=uncultured Helicobacter sp. TaxID=175537 RepID=UPI0026337234|nr:LPP20 family lipoprotein [uncultured Helicobacter sp.]
MKVLKFVNFGAIASLVLVAILGINGCKKGLGDNEAINASLEGAPAWVTESNDDLLSATGSAKVKNNNLNFATTQAGAAARVELATQISTRVESKYKELATSGEDSVNQEAVQAIRNSVDQVLAGSKITNKWVSKDGTLWVLVKIQKLNTDLLKSNLLNSKTLDKAAAQALSQAVDEILDTPAR